jgi:vacuolar iron transporter family protein
LSRTRRGASYDRLFERPEQATRLLIYEEVGLDERCIGAPLAAGVGSFLSFTLGAVIPLVPFILAGGAIGFITSLGASLGALFALGLGISRLTYRSPLFTALRQLLLGAIAAGVTFAVGTLLGATV